YLPPAQADLVAGLQERLAPVLLHGELDIASDGIELLGSLDVAVVEPALAEGGQDEPAVTVGRLAGHLGVGVHADPLGVGQPLWVGLLLEAPADLTDHAQEPQP